MRYSHIPVNGVRVPYVATVYDVTKGTRRTWIEESLFTCFLSHESGTSQKYRVRMAGVPSIASARKLAREHGYDPEAVETLHRGYYYVIPW